MKTLILLFIAWLFYALYLLRHAEKSKRTEIVYMLVFAGWLIGMLFYEGVKYETFYLISALVIVLFICMLPFFYIIYVEVLHPIFSGED